MKKTSKINSEIDLFSFVERYFIGHSPFEPLYLPTKKIPAIVTESFSQLGRLTALRFLERVQTNTNGAISVPTGKTPEHFIAQVLNGWDKPDVAQQLRHAGIVQRQAFFPSATVKIPFHPHWLTWSKIPLDRPNFHQPQYFGYLEFME